MKTSLYLLFPILASILWFPNPAQAEERKDSSIPSQQISTKAADLIIPGSPVAQPDVSNLAQTSEPPAPDVKLDTDAVVDPSQSYRLPINNYWYVSGSSGIFSSQSDVPVKVTRNITRTVPGDLSLVSPLGFNAAVGYQWKLLRTELELGYVSTVISRIKYKVDSTSQPLEGNIDRVIVLFNGYYDVFTGSRLRPYLGAGVGIGWNAGKIKQAEPQSQGVDASGTSLSYQLKVGVQYEIAKKRSVFAELRYLNIGGYNSKPSGSIETFELGSANSYGLSIGYKQGF
ncbi:MAG: porin family protein [Cylindrospermopsis raciborskii KL1]|uniref:outer membrane protein n=1 Tax=Cylindrospermopsis raciborskii TaxID=77022 RepID=UPI001A18471B|nr:porin family protein [Cylindrospermopsis raciborskii]MBG0744771.1 porin family protein [Cylindrospermopsis raciborskii KL1]